MQFKLFKYMAGVAAAVLLLASCEKKDYPAGLPEYEHHYYLVYIPNNNTQVNVQRTQTALLKLPALINSSHRAMPNTAPADWPRVPMVHCMYRMICRARSLRSATRSSG